MPLTSVRLLVLLSLALLLVLTVTLRGVRVGRAHRGAKAVLGGLLALSLVVALGAAGVNRNFQLYRSWHDLLGPDSSDLVHASSAQDLARATSPLGAVVPAHGTMLSLTIPATTSGLDVGGAYVYLPPQYRVAAYATTTFPVVQALNGSPGTPVDWINGIKADTQLDAAISSHRMAPAIVVFAPTNTSILRSLECTDTADGLLDETYLTTDVHTWVTSHFRTDNKRWTAMGYSTGGYCALSLSFRHPDLFARAISLDGYGAALSDRYARGLWKSPQDKLDHSPNWWVMHHPPAGIDVYILAGSSDREASGDALTLWKALVASGWRTPQSRLVVEKHGRHTFDAWLLAFTPSLEWALPGGSARVVTTAPALKELIGTQVASARPKPSAHVSHSPTPHPSRATASPHVSPRPSPGPSLARPQVPRPSVVASPRDTSSPSASPSPTAPVLGH